jgi:hypothetical protein
MLSVCSILLRKPGRCRHTWENNIKMDLLEIKLGWSMKWTDVTQDRNRWRAIISAVKNIRIPLIVENFFTS